ncbi:MAG: response regulator [Acidobacteria bacterium]|nr:response regulator [Acidobacteriota bacterium]
MRRKTLLVVEDDDLLRAVYRQTLSLGGYEVREAYDGLAALQAIDIAPPDVIVLDLVMPRVTGYDVLAEVRQDAHTRHIPVIIVTGTQDSLEGAGADCVLRKPVDMGLLLRAVARCSAPRDAESQKF